MRGGKRGHELQFVTIPASGSIRVEHLLHCKTKRAEGGDEVLGVDEQQLVELCGTVFLLGGHGAEDKKLSSHSVDESPAEEVGYSAEVITMAAATRGWVVSCDVSSSEKSRKRGGTSSPGCKHAGIAAPRCIGGDVRLESDGTKQDRPGACSARKVIGAASAKEKVSSALEAAGGHAKPHAPALAGAEVRRAGAQNVLNVCSCALADGGAFAFKFKRPRAAPVFVVVCPPLLSSRHYSTGRTQLYGGESSTTPPCCYARGLRGVV
ncbi:hypothetical protein C8J57DRAFT_1238139 [Mycena rebaudengoi]|nr:hypothetical protein C8J57DRAFT_1238139 [Mycena rebaudengoi]